MQYKTILGAAALALTSFTGFAASFYNPVTDELVFDTESFEFTGSCGTSSVSPNEESGSFDLIYESVIANAKDHEIIDKTCQLKFDVEVPAGWKVEVQTEAAIGGTYLGTNLVSFQHTLAGTTREAAFEYLTGAGTYAISQPLEILGSSYCGEDVTLKTVANLIALGNGGLSLVNLSNGSLNGTSTSWRYFLNFYPC
ncbi:MAG: hypothetical protein AAGB12_04735 [Pseudomonadota bacterium]